MRKNSLSEREGGEGERGERERERERVLFTSRSFRTLKFKSGHHCRCARTNDANSIRTNPIKKLTACNRAREVSSST